MNSQVRRHQVLLPVNLTHHPFSKLFTPPDSHNPRIRNSKKKMTHQAVLPMNRLRRSSAKSERENTDILSECDETTIN
jgi:hypothetical protein